MNNSVGLSVDSSQEQGYQARLTTMRPKILFILKFYKKETEYFASIASRSILVHYHCECEDLFTSVYLTVPYTLLYMNLLP